MAPRRNQKPASSQDGITLTVQSANVTENVSPPDPAEPEWIVDGTLSKDDEATLFEAERILQDRENRNAKAQAKTTGIAFANYPVNTTNIRARPRRKKVFPDGAVQGVGLTPCYPNDESLEVGDLESYTHIAYDDADRAWEDKVRAVINSHPWELVAAQKHITMTQYQHSHQRDFFRFDWGGDLLVVALHWDIDLHERYGKDKFNDCAAYQAIEQTLDKSPVGLQPSREVEYYVAAVILGEQNGSMGGNLQHQGPKLRIEATNRLRYQPGLRDEVEKLLQSKTAHISKIRHKLHTLTKQMFKLTTPNAHHNMVRNIHVTDNRLWHTIENFDIYVALDKYGRVLALHDDKAEHRLLKQLKKGAAAEAFSTYHHLTPLEYPDATRHIEHAGWLKDNPTYNIEAPGANPRKANPGSCHHGFGSATGDPNGKKMGAKAGQGYAKYSAFTKTQYEKFRYGAMGAGTEMANFYFPLADEPLHKMFQAAYKSADDEIKAPTRRDGSDTFSMIAPLNMLHTSMHVDESDVKEGFAFIYALGDFEGGHMVYPQLGIRIEQKPGGIQLMRGRMMLHFICPWTGARYILVYAMGGGVRRHWLTNLVDKTEIPVIPTRGQEQKLAEERMKVHDELVKLFVDGSASGGGT